MQSMTKRALVLLVVLVAAGAGAQTNSAPPAAEAAAAKPAEVAPALSVKPAAETPAGTSDLVTINVEGGSLIQVLNAFSRQTGRSIVIGPDVSATVNVRLSDVPWTDALDVILRPYGYGFKLQGDTIVVTKMEKTIETEAMEPLVSQVFNLKYLDAAGVNDLIKAQLSPRGKWSSLTIRGQRGWAAQGQGYRGASSGSGITTLERRQRVQEGDTKALEAERLRSKTIIVVDVPSVMEKLTKVLAEVDRKPVQVLIETRFVEVTQDALKDLGVEWGTGKNATSTDEVKPINVSDKQGLFGVGARQSGGNVTPDAFLPASQGLTGTKPYGGGLSLLFQQLTDIQFEVLLHMLEEKNGANLLSSPRVMALNDQEATIMVGEKYPIIKGDVTGGGGTGSSVTTSLDYYENIGIQLNVIPQVCEDNYIRMIVNPRVSTLLGFVSGTALSSSGDTAVNQTPYPRMSVRESETQIMLHNGQTVVIGGLIEDQEKKTVVRVPVLGSIPLIGALFRRETVDKKKTDLLIFLTATVVDSDGAPVGAAAQAGAGGLVPETMKAEFTKQAETRAAADVQRAANAQAVRQAEARDQAAQVEKEKALLADESRAAEAMRAGEARKAATSAQPAAEAAKSATEKAVLDRFPVVPTK